MKRETETDIFVCFMSLLTRGRGEGHSISDFIQRQKWQQRAPTSNRHGP